MPYLFLLPYWFMSQIIFAEEMIVRTSAVKFTDPHQAGTPILLLRVKSQNMNIVKAEHQDRILVQMGKVVVIILRSLSSKKR